MTIAVAAFRRGGGTWLFAGVLLAACSRSASDAVRLSISPARATAGSDATFSIAATTDQVPVVEWSSTHTFVIGLPANPALLNNHLYTTAAVFVPGVNAFGAISANGIDGLLGNQ